MIKTVITKAGLELRQRVIAQKGSIEFTKAKLGSGMAQNPDDIIYYDDILKYEIDAKIKSSIAESTVHELVVILDNSVVETDFMLSEIGICAADQDGAEVMYAYVYTDTAEYVPSKDIAKVVKEWVINTAISQSEDITILVDDSNIYATMEDLRDVHKSIPRIFMSSTEPESWRDGDWWYQVVGSIENIGTGSGVVFGNLGESGSGTDYILADL